MSNHPSSSRKCSTAPAMATSISNERRSTENLKKKKKQKQSPRSPLQPLNHVIPISISRSSSNKSHCSSISSSISVEAPKGCLRFFSKKTPLHHNRSKPKFLSKTPNPSNPIRSKENEVQYLFPRKSKKNSNPKVKTSPWLSKIELQEQQEKCCYSGEPFNFPGFVNTSANSTNHDCTPVGKLASGSVVKMEMGSDNGCNSRGNNSGSSSKTKTPPVQSSLSPEIQCGSSMLVSGATPNTALTCYGAGHVISGVKDRRKCRPRGTLIVGAGAGAGSHSLPGGIDDGIGSSGVRKSRASFIPLPTEASMSWNLSPHHEDEDGSVVGDCCDGLHRSQNLMGCSMHHLPGKFNANMFGYGNYRGSSSSTDSDSGMKTRITLLSPKALPEFQKCLRHSSEKVAKQSSSASPCGTPILSQEKKKFSRYNFTTGNSPLSEDTFGSENVIQTPTSGSSKERHLSRSWLKKEDDQKHCFAHELDSVTNLVQQASLSPKSHTSPWDPLGLSYMLGDMTSPSNCINCRQLQKNSDTRASGFSNSTFENISESQMRISWRDGLVSRMFEMDDLDFCRLLSDEENEADGYDDLLKLHQEGSHSVELLNDDQFLDDGLSSPEFVEHEVKIGRKEKVLLSPHQSNGCAESMCIDGGGLVASGDSDWTLCYKNQLFQMNLPHGKASEAKLSDMSL